MSDSIAPTSRSRWRLVKLEAEHVWTLAWPLIVTNMLNVTVGIIDLKMVGVLGVDSIAAVGLARQVMMFIMVLMIAISGGSSVLVAHAHGARERRRVGDIAAQSFAFMILTAVFVVTPTGYLLAQRLLVLLGAAASVVRLGTGYLHILFLGSVFTMINFGVTGVLLGIGRTRVSLVLLVGVNLLNIVFNYLLIFGVGPLPALGVPGAALGTVIARALGSFAGIWVLRTPRLPVQMKFSNALVLDLSLLRMIIYLGGPRSLQGIVRTFSRLMTIRIIALLPDATRAISAYSVGMQVRMISSFIGLAFMNASMARVGQNMGGRDPEMAERSGWISAGMATCLMSVLALVFFLLPETIMAFFTDDYHVIGMGREFFMIVALTEPIMAFAFALGGALRGGGDPISPFIYASVSDIVIVILVGFILAVQLNMGFTGIAIGIAASAVTRAVPTMLKFGQGAWKTTRF